MLIFPNLSLTLEFPLPQFYHFSSSFFFIFLLLHIFYYFPSSILIFCLLHNYITIPPPSTPHLFYIFFHPQIHRPHIDPTSTLDSTFFQHSFLNRETIYNHHHISIFPSTTTTFLLFPLLLLISLFSLEKAIEAKIKA